MKGGAIIRHPLPQVDKIPKEIDAAPQARYFEQAQNGLDIRNGAALSFAKRKLVIKSMRELISRSLGFNKVPLTTHY
jgi:hypothetical protein